MKYAKPPLSFSDQADLLMRRGLEVASKQELVEKLEAVSYYRLSAYWYPFKQPDETLVPGTTLEKVWRRYTFDRQLRLLVMDAIERAEIAIRTQVVTRHTLKYGPFGYLDRANLPGLAVDSHRELLERIRDEAKRSREAFVTHFFAKYTSETDLPLWMACELMTFGGLLTLFRGVETPIKQGIASAYGIPDRVLVSWMLALNHVRNVCAHHARLWNRVLGLKPMIPRPNKHPDWHSPVRIGDDRIFGVLSILFYLLKQVAPKSQWKTRLTDLLARYPDIPIQDMGFPADWEKSPIWRI